MKCLLLIAVLLLSACSTGAKVNLVSYPEGAEIVDPTVNKTVGIAPLQVTLELRDSSKDSAGCFNVGPVEAHWISGAKVSSPLSNRFCGSKNGTYTIFLRRPNDYKGLEQDMAYAAQKQQAKALAQQQKAAQDAAWWSAFAAGYNNSKANSLTCTHLGVITTCN